MVSPAFSRSVLFLIAGVLAPVFLTQCKSTGKSYKDVSYDPAKLKTPAGHGLDRNDYPFDENGAYRKDWVKNNTSGRDRSASPQVGATTAVAAATPSTTPSSTSYPTYAEASAARASGSFVGPAGATVGTGTGTGTVTGAATGAVTGAATGTAATLASFPDPGSGAGGVELASAGMTSSAPAPTAAATSYHKVNSGDTLFALAGKYNTSVPELKRVNGLSGDSIRSGQSLRIP